MQGSKSGFGLFAGWGHGLGSGWVLQTSTARKQGEGKKKSGGVETDGWFWTSRLFGRPYFRRSRCQGRGYVFRQTSVQMRVV